MTVAKHSKTIPTEVVGEHILLPLLASVLYEKQYKLDILDFGGGAGIAYLQLLNSIPRHSNVNYHIVELDRICKTGSQLFLGDERIHFHPALPEHLPDLDILHMNSSLQYIEDYVGLLNRLCTYEPKYFLFVRLSAGDIPTYATAQKNMPGEPIPYWFLNVDELIEIMLQNKYFLIFKSALEQEYNQDNFPEEYRLGRTANLLFARG
jgi:putative methyltransferase (TIGR04325 family)